MNLFLGITSSGVAFGSFIFAPIITLLSEHFGWRGAMLIYSGMFANGFVFAALLRPIQSFQNKRISDRRDAYNKNVTVSSYTVKNMPQQKYAAVESSNGCLDQLPMLNENISDKQEVNYMGSNVSLPYSLAADNDRKIKWTTNKSETVYQQIVQTLRNMFNVQQFVNIYVILFLLVNIGMCTVLYGIYTFTPLFMETEGLDVYKASFVLSMVGLGDIIGRLGAGFIGYRVDTTIVYIIVTASTCVFFISCSFARNLAALTTMSLMIGVGIGKYDTLRVCAMICSHQTSVLFRNSKNQKKLKNVYS